MITVEEVAAHLNTINYEVVCQISSRVPQSISNRGQAIQAGKGGKTKSKKINREKRLPGK